LYIRTGSRLEHSRAQYTDWRRFTRQGHEPDNSPTQGIFVEPRSCCPVNANFLASPAALLSAFPASMAVSLSADYPPPGDGWASMVNTQLCPCSRNRPRPTTTPRVTTRLAASKLSTLYGGGNVPRLGEIPSVFQRPHARQQWQLYNGVSVTMAISSPVSTRLASVVSQGPLSRGYSGGLRNGGGGGSDSALSNTSGRFSGSAMAAAHQQATLAGLGMGVGRFNLGLGSPELGMRTGSTWCNSHSWG
jgi:hypothetical protein